MAPLWIGSLFGIFLAVLWPYFAVFLTRLYTDYKLKQTLDQYPAERPFPRDKALRKEGLYRQVAKSKKVKAQSNV